MSPPITLPTRRSRRFGPRRLLGRGMGGGGAFAAPAVYFDGTNDAFRFRNGGSALPTRGDKSGWIASWWVYFTDYTASGRYLDALWWSEPGGGTDLVRGSSPTGSERYWGTIKHNPGGTPTNIYNNWIAPTGQHDGTWHHYLWADWRGSATVSENSYAVYIDDAQWTYATNLAQVGPGWDTDSIVTWFVGKESAAANYMQATHIAEYFCATLDSFYDITSEANRRKFISADGKPVSLGEDGSTPLGYQPEVYMTGTNAADWGNVGSLGAWETVYGTFTDSDKAPVARP